MKGNRESQTTSGLTAETLIPDMSSVSHRARPPGHDLKTRVTMESRGARGDDPEGKIG